jgi:hypothetical protein
MVNSLTNKTRALLYLEVLDYIMIYTRRGGAGAAAGPSWAHNFIDFAHRLKC